MVEAMYAFGRGGVLRSKSQHPTWQPLPALRSGLISQSRQVSSGLSHGKKQISSYKKIQDDVAEVRWKIAQSDHRGCGAIARQRETSSRRREWTNFCCVAAAVEFSDGDRSESESASAISGASAADREGAIPVVAEHGAFGAGDSKHRYERAARGTRRGRYGRREYADVHR